MSYRDINNDKICQRNDLVEYSASQRIFNYRSRNIIFDKKLAAVHLIVNHLHGVTYQKGNLVVVVD